MLFKDREIEIGNCDPEFLAEVLNHQNDNNHRIDFHEDLVPILVYALNKIGELETEISALKYRLDNTRI